MVKLSCDDIFDVIKNAQNAGLLGLIPPMYGEIAPGERFFESFQRDVLEKVDLEKLNYLLFNLAPTIHYMTDASRWKPAEFTAEELFEALRHLQQMGAFEVVQEKMKIPGSGDRFFEYYQEILINKIGTETMDKLLHILGQGIQFLATEAAMVNVTDFPQINHKKGESKDEQY